MSHLLKRGAALGLLLLLSACGGDAPPAAPAVSVSAAKRAMAAPSAATYHDLMQRIYVAYFGRPADPAGLGYWAGQYSAYGLPATMGDASAAYATNPTLAQFVDFFGTSAESAALYPGDNGVFVSAIYRNLFNREPDADGKAYWVDLLDRGALTRPIAALYIMSGAQGSDVTIINKKVEMATRFTGGLNTDARRAVYAGEGALSQARSMLAAVGLATNTATSTLVATTINTLENGASTSLLRAYLGTWSARCDGREMEHITVTESPAVANAIEIAIVTQYHAAIGCGGAVLATETMSASIRAAYAGRVNSAIVAYDGAPSFPATIDLASLTLPGHTRNVTGSAVTQTVIGGQAQWCINFGGGNSTCVHDEGYTPFQGPISGGLYATADTMYLLAPAGSIYYADATYVRR